MKVYVEIEPEILKEVEVVSLVDHDKQVRKEVVEEIQSNIEKKARYSTNNNDGWDILIDENSFLEILDQTQGVADGKINN